MLSEAIEQGLPELMRERVIAAVLTAQALRGGPVTSQEARGNGHAVMRHSRAFTEVALKIVRLGPDEKGRVLHAVGRDRKGVALWWVEAPRANGEA